MSFFRKHLGIIFRDLTALGSFAFYGLLLVLVLAFKEGQLLIMLFAGLLLIMALAVGIRLAYFKNRPRKEKYSTLLERIDASSFPSIHTARIFFVAFILSHFFADRLLTIFFLCLAGLVSYSRIYLKKHYWLDLLGGLFLAMLVFWGIISFF